MKNPYKTNDIRFEFEKIVFLRDEFSLQPQTPFILTKLHLKEVQLHRAQSMFGDQWKMLTLDSEDFRLWR